MNTTIILIAGFAAALLLSRSLMLSIIELSDKYRLYDKANLIKLHEEQVSSLGGVAVFCAFWLLAFVFVRNGFLPLFFAGSLMLFLIGLRDDLLGVHAYFRLIVQVVVASILIYWGMAFPPFTAFGHSFPQVVVAMITVVFVLGVINAWNFIDGSNGLAGGLTIISSAVFGLYFFLNGNDDLAILSCILTGAMLGFISFNFGTQARAFMGDNGSTFSGLLLSFLVISFIQEDKHLPVSNATLVQLCAAPLLLPMIDMARVVLVRLFKGKSPFKGDRTHIHHLMKARGFSPNSIALILWMIHGAIIVLSVLLPLNAFLIALFLMVGGFSIYVLRKNKVAVSHTLMKPVKHGEESFSKVAH